MGRLFRLPPATAHSKRCPLPSPPFPHSKKGSVPGANIPGTLPFPSHQHQTGRYPLIVPAAALSAGPPYPATPPDKSFWKGKGGAWGGEGEPFSKKVSLSPLIKTFSIPQSVPGGIIGPAPRNGGPIRALPGQRYDNRRPRPGRSPDHPGRGPRHRGPCPCPCAGAGHDPDGR